jgi:signal transduction histidine kinase
MVITLAAVVVYSLYITAEIERLEDLQSDLVDRNRRDSLQLVRIQNDLNSVAQAMRDMLDGDLPYPLTAWEPQFGRLRTHLEDALRIQDEVAIVNQTPEQRDYLRRSMNEFWSAVDHMFASARDGAQAGAIAEIRSLQARRDALSNTVARLLVENNESEEAAAIEIARVYTDVRGQVSLFLFGTLSAILATGVYLIYSNRKVFQRISELSAQRSELARALIASQESTLRHISRDLHDEFGQVLTAIGSLLARARRKLGEDSPLAGDLDEVREIAQSTLDNVRSMSQALHPAVLEEGGIESAVEWLVSTTRRHAGLVVTYEKNGDPFPIDSDHGIHIYRVLQEALNNVVRHSGSKAVRVGLRYRDSAVELEVEDHGKGFSPNASHRGIGLTAMRERAELLGGTITFSGPRPPTAGSGTRIRLVVPRDRLKPGAANTAKSSEEGR